MITWREKEKNSMSMPGCLKSVSVFTLTIHRRSAVWPHMMSHARGRGGRDSSHPGQREVMKMMLLLITSRTARDAGEDAGSMTGNIWLTLSSVDC